MLGLRQAPAVEEIAAVPGVAHVEVVGPASDGMFRVEPEKGADPIDALVARAAERGWRLSHVAPAASHIEDVFVQLTQREEAA
jgi:hypothetical protein